MVENSFLLWLSFRHAPRWLIILGNLNASDSDRLAWPWSILHVLNWPYRGGVIVTTRSSRTSWNMSSEWDTIEMGRMDEKEAIDLLRSTSGLPITAFIEFDGAKRLVRLFDHGPLAISLAGAYLSHHPSPKAVTGYMRLFSCEDGRPKITPHADGTTMTDGVAAALNVTYHALKTSRAHTSMSIVDYFGFLDLTSSGIWTELLSLSPSTDHWVPECMQPQNREKPHRTIRRMIELMKTANLRDKLSPRTSRLLVYLPKDRTRRIHNPPAHTAVVRVQDGAGSIFQRAIQEHRRIRLVSTAPPQPCNRTKGPSTSCCAPLLSRPNRPTMSPSVTNRTTAPLSSSRGASKHRGLQQTKDCPHPLDAVHNPHRRSVERNGDRNHVLDALPYTEIKPHREEYNTSRSGKTREYLIRCQEIYGL